MYVIGLESFDGSVDVLWRRWKQGKKSLPDMHVWFINGERLVTMLKF